MTVSITGRMPTDRASRYAKQLANHLSRKIEATFDVGAGHGIVRKDDAVASLAVTPTTLEIAVSAPNADSLFLLMGIIQNHLEGFAAKESLACAWDDAELSALYQERRASRQ